MSETTDRGRAAAEAPDRDRCALGHPACDIDHDPFDDDTFEHDN